MKFLYSIFFGAGVAAFSYTRLGRRAGYGNTKNVVTVVAVIFILSTIVFFSILSLFIHN